MMCYYKFFLNLVRVLCLLFFFIIICLFRTVPVAYGRSQARGLIEAVAASLYHSHSNTDPSCVCNLYLQLTATPDH